jgi:hypothetical protein
MLIQMSKFNRELHLQTRVFNFQIQILSNLIADLFPGSQILSLKKQNKNQKIEIKRKES